MYIEDLILRASLHRRSACGGGGPPAATTAPVAPNSFSSSPLFHSSVQIIYTTIFLGARLGLDVASTVLKGVVVMAVPPSTSTMDAGVGLMLLFCLDARVVDKTLTLTSTAVARVPPTSLCERRIRGVCPPFVLEPHRL